MKTGSRKVRAWLLMLLPGIIIAGSFAVLGQFDLAAGIACGCALWVASSSVLGLCTREITLPTSTWRRVLFVLIHVAKYALIALALYTVVRHSQTSLLGLAIGYTIGMAGYIAAQFADSRADAQDNDAASVS